MAINRNRFLAVFLVSNLLFIGVIAAVVATDVALAVPMAGVGGFTVTFERLEGQGLQQYPAVASNDDCEAFPAAVTQMESATATNLQLFRDVNVPEAAPGDLDTFRLVISADSAEYTGLTQEFMSLESDSLTFPQGQQVEQRAGGDPQDQFMISGDEVIIENGVIHANSQFTESISLSGSSVSLETNPDDTVQTPEIDCPTDGGAGNGTGNDSEGK
ncbi:MAG: hypothetical protein U5K37_02800 [Natrialbaceae archaeon]|nr:hypothetical protein [Natrialbaceae archaeon]